MRSTYVTLRSMRLKPYLLPLVQFTLIGPGVGVLTAMFLGTQGAPTLSGSGLLLLFGYGIGVFPAALAGVMYVSAWNAKALFKGLNIGEFGALLGALSGVAALAAFATAMSGTPFPKSPIIYAIPLAAGAVCGYLAAQVRDAAYGWVDAR